MERDRRKKEWGGVICGFAAVAQQNTAGRNPPRHRPATVPMYTAPPSFVHVTLPEYRKNRHYNTSNVP